MTIPFYKCPFCPCQFTTKHDLDRHLDAFTRYPEHHRARIHDQFIRNKHPQGDFE